MPLSVAEQLLLYEVYECPTPELQQVVVTGGKGTTMFPNYLPSGTTPVQVQLQIAIDLINADESRVTRVSAILLEYADIYSDLTAKIDRDGYKSSFRGNLKSLFRALFPYTGIIVQDGSGSGVTTGRYGVG